MNKNNKERYFAVLLASFSLLVSFLFSLYLLTTLHCFRHICDLITDGEEEFYYTEIEIEHHATPPPTLSHRDLTRPPHEDPEYQRQLVSSFRQQIRSEPINIPQSPCKVLKLSPRPHSPKMPVSPRRLRGENKKCRKMYGMEHREQWCTQCKWKKACSRFGD